MNVNIGPVDLYTIRQIVGRRLAEGGGGNRKNVWGATFFSVHCIPYIDIYSWRGMYNNNF